ncbi:hypothetical protein BGH96_00015, partial [Snodgrassella alvi]
PDYMYVFFRINYIYSLYQCNQAAFFSLILIMLLDYKIKLISVDIICRFFSEKNLTTIRID